MQTHNKATARSYQHPVEHMNNDLRSSPSHGNPQASPPRERRRGKDLIVKDQSDQVYTNGVVTQVPFEVTDPEAPITQAQLATMFRAIMDTVRLQIPN